MTDLILCTVNTSEQDRCETCTYGIYNFIGENFFSKLPMRLTNPIDSSVIIWNHYPFFFLRKESLVVVYNKISSLGRRSLLLSTHSESLHDFFSLKCLFFRPLKCFYFPKELSPNCLSQHFMKTLPGQSHLCTCDSSVFCLQLISLFWVPDPHIQDHHQ